MAHSRAQSRRERSRQSPRWLLAILAPAVILSAAGLLVYSDSFRVPFLHDDFAAITDNDTIRHLWPIRGWLSPPAESTVQGRPVVNLTLAVNYAAGLLNPAGYHLLNIFIHILTGLLLSGIVRRTLLLPRFEGRFVPAAPWLAWAAAFLWLLHPLHTSAVTYVIQRAEALMAMFYLLTLYAVMRAATAETKRASRAWSALAVAGCALGMGTKEVMASTPVAVLLYDRAFMTGSFRGSLRARPCLYTALAATWAPLGFLVFHAGGRSGTVTIASDTVQPLYYAMTQCRYLFHYLRLSFWPDPLVFDYGLPDAGVPIVRSFWTWLPWGVPVLALLGLSLFALVRAPRVGFLAASFFMILAPSSSFIAVVTDVVAERRMYLPLAAVVVGAVMGVYLAGRWLLARRGSPPQFRGRLGWTLSMLAVTALAAALGHATYRRNLDFESALSIWEDTVRKHPGNARARNNYGLALHNAGRDAEAFPEFNAALVLKHDYADAYYNRGLARVSQRQLGLAIEDFTRAIEIQHDYLKAWNNRGVAYIRAGMYVEAIADFDKVLELEPSSLEAVINRATARTALGQFEGALRDYDRALAVQPNFAAAYNARGAVHAEMKRYDLAVEDCTRAIKLQPSFAPAYRTRAIAWYHLGKYDSSWEDIAALRRLGVTPEPQFVEELAKSSGRRQ